MVGPGPLADEAEAAYSVALRLDPRSGDAYNSLASLARLEEDILALGGPCDTDGGLLRNGTLRDAVELTLGACVPLIGASVYLGLHRLKASVMGGKAH